MQQVLWMDDERFPPNPHYSVARTAGQAKTAMIDKSWDVIYVDHDLASFDETGKETTGYDVLKWFFEETNRPLPTRFVLLSSNPVGRRNLVELIKQYAPSATIDSHEYVPPPSVDIELQITAFEGATAHNLARTTVTVYQPRGFSHVRVALEEVAREMVLNSIHTGPLK